MVAFPTVISLRFEAKSKPVGYLMVEAENFETAATVARHWAEHQGRFEFDSVVEHQGVVNLPLEFVEEFEGYRICELPF